MLKKSVAFLVAALLILPVASFADNYAKVVVVAKSGGEFTSPIQAMESITTASKGRQFLVKVMPGTYDLGTKSLQMKEYVALEGSGVDNTVITSANVNADIDTCSVGTVIMANNAAVRNVKIVNTAQDSENETLIAGVVFDNVNAKAEGINVLVGYDNIYSARNFGICSVGTSGHATLDNITVESRSGNNGLSAAITLAFDGSATLMNSKLAAVTAKNGNINVLNCVNGQNRVSALTVTNSSIEGSVLHPSGYNIGIHASDCSASISHSTVKLSGGNRREGAKVNDLDFSCDNSKIYSQGDIIFSDGDAIVKITNSLLQGRIPNLPNLQLLNNHTENNAPIPNR